MADMITYKLKGVEELRAKFKTLNSEMQRTVLLPAMKDGMDIVRADAVRRADLIDDPATFPDIGKNIAMVEDTKFFEETGSTKVSVGVRKTRAGVRGGNTFFWWYQELGTSHIRPKAFMRSALAGNRQAVFAEVISSGKYQLTKLGLD